MIRLHEFNTRWASKPVGIVDDPGFFALPPEERQTALAAFCWVEFKSSFRDAPPLPALMQAGFFLADTQINFQIALPPATGPRSAESLQINFADEAPFEIYDAEIRSFTHERFQYLPGLKVEESDRRYTHWARQLIRERPEASIQACLEGCVQGWFFAQPSKDGLHLTLAMLHRNASISGLALYEQCMAAYAARGHRSGWASFSVTNTAVLNILAKLGAHFREPTGIWLWVAKA